MTPADYAARFWNLRVFLTEPDPDQPPPTPMYLPDPKRPGVVASKAMEPGRWQKFRLERYRLYNSGSGDFLAHALRNQANIGLKIMRCDGTYETLSVSYPEISYALAAPFWGKGYPEECQVVCQLWQRYGINKESIETMLKRTAIGLDCNGFVGGYIERRASPSTWRRQRATKTSDLIKTLVQPPSAFFKSWDDFKPPGLDCLIFGHCDAAGNVEDFIPNTSITGHIVLTEPGTLARSTSGGAPVTVDVVEATGPIGAIGLVRSKYEILSMTLDSQKRGIFRVRRGSKIGTQYEFLLFRIIRLT